MRFSDIIILAKKNLALGIATTIIVTILLSLGYFVVYKKLTKGTKTLSKQTLGLFMISVCYIIFVLGSVLLGRGNHYSSYNLQPFISYIETWNQWSISGWRNIILSILLFIPLGFLLPLWSEKFQKVWRTVLCGFVFIFTIELVQLISLLGVFDVNDLINNTLGILVGYGISMLFLASVHRKKMATKDIFLYIAPLLIVVVVFGSVFVAYSIQELGNLSSAYYSKVNMERILLSSEVEFSEEIGTADIYVTTTGNEQDAKELANTIFAQIGMIVDETKTDIYDDTAIYYAKDDNISVWINYRGMAYRYTDFSQFNHDIGKVIDADEATIRTALTAFNIELPEDCLFEITKNSSYKFSADMLSFGGKILDGSLSCEYYSDGTIKNINNGIIACTPYRVGDIISEQKAYEQIVAGKFVLNYPQSMSSITIKNVELAYELDSKGYYQPIYRFYCIFVDESNEYKSYIQIPALK